MWNNREYKVKLGENTIRDYERIMLTSGDCGLFMPMWFINENGSEYSYYGCSGFAPLDRYMIELTEDALYILENVMLILACSVEFLIEPSKVTLTRETVFYNKETGQIKIAYVPADEYGPDMKKRLLSFIGELKSEIRDGGEKYLVKAAEYIYYHNYDMGEMVNRIGLLKRRLYDEKTGAPRKERQEAGGADK